MEGKQKKNTWALAIEDGLKILQVKYKINKSTAAL